MFIATQLNWTQLNSTDPVEQRTAKSVVFCLWRHDLQTESTVVHAVELSWVELCCYKRAFMQNCAVRLLRVGLRRDQRTSKWRSRCDCVWSTVTCWRCSLQRWGNGLSLRLQFGRNQSHSSSIDERRSTISAALQGSVCRPQLSCKVKNWLAASRYLLTE